jgi:hypothetical protein
MRAARYGARRLPTARTRPARYSRFQQGASGQFAYTTVLIGKGVITGTTMGAGSQSGFFPGTVWQIAD